MQTQEAATITPNPNQSSELVAHGVQVQETMTTPSRPGKKPRPVWIVSGNIFGLESFFRDIGGRKFHGSWSFFEDPTEQLLERLKDGKRESFAEQVESTLERKLERAARFESYSNNAKARAEKSYKTASSIGAMIPMGQPILVGHHSEKRHRRDLARIDSRMQKSIEESKKAEYFADKANRLAAAETKLESREFVGNRIEDAKAEIAKLLSWATAENPRLIQAQEKLEYWQNRMSLIEQKLKENGCNVPSPETIKVGDLIQYIGWYPVVRINKKTVTVSHWLDVATFTYKIPYSKIKAIKSKPANLSSR